MQAYSAGAFHDIAPGWRPTHNRHTLRMLERAGFIRLPREFKRPGRDALGCRVRHCYVLEGDNAPPYAGAPFKVKGRTFRLQWADGCFNPFVWEWRA